MTIEDKKWIMTFNENDWSDDYGVHFDSKEEAESFLHEVNPSELIENYLESTNMTFEEFTQDGGLLTALFGQVHTFKPQVTADSLIGDLQEQAENFSLDHSEGYLTGIPETQMEELNKTLSSAFDDWSKKNNQEPRFYQILNTFEQSIDFSEDIKSGLINLD